MSLRNRGKISQETLIIRQDGFLTADLDGEKVMMSINQGKYYGLNSMGSLIWEYLNEPLTVQQLIVKLMMGFQIDEDTCFGDVSCFLNKMQQKGLISL